MPAPDTADRVALIERSLHAVAERIGDPGALVYRRLFELAPELQPLFVGDATGSVRGEMLQRAFETVHDLLAGAPYAHGMIAAEFQNHQQIGVPAERFGLLFAAMVDVFRTQLGAQWDAATDAAWRSVLAQVAQITGQPLAA
jgi:nitric oxide dioxygenase